MTRFTRSALAGLGLLCAVSPFAVAQESAMPAGGMAYVNGGFGYDEEDRIKQEGPNYSLRLQFSEGRKGEWVSDVNLAIVDTSGRTVFTLPKAGPLTDVMLPPGSYRISASYEGRTKTQEISIGGSGRAGKDLAFSWQGE